MESADSLLAGLVFRPTLRSRNEVGYFTLRSWKVDARREQIAAFKAEKRLPTSDLVDVGAQEIAAFLGKYVPISQAAVTCIPCGHSRREDCFGKQLANAAAGAANIDFLPVWQDRFCSGVSHPKEFAKLPPLVLKNTPKQFMIVIDDVASSGWHLEEAIMALRGLGIPALALAWIGGSVVEGRDRRKSEANGQGDGDEDRQGSPFGRGGRVWRL